MQNMSDLELIEACKAGSDEAFQEIYRRYYPRIYRIAMKISKCDGDAQDAAQETMIQVQSSINSLQNPEYFKQWLNRIVVGKCNRIFRKNKYQSVDMQEYHKAFNTPEEHREYLPQEQMHFNSDHELINSLIAQIPKDQQEVLIMTYLESMSIKEISDILKVPQGTVKSRTFAAKKHLRKLILEYENQTGEKIDFHSFLLASGILTAYAGELTGAASAVTAQSSLSLLKRGFSHVSLLQAAGASIMILGGAAAAVYAGGYLNQNNSNNQLPSRMISHAPVDQQSNRETINFPQVQIEDEEKRFENAKDAYFYLYMWADSEAMLNDKTSDEIHRVKPLYEALKKSGSPYYHQLLTLGWSNEYEQRIK